jgi:hypothetical protein
VPIIAKCNPGYYITLEKATECTPCGEGFKCAGGETFLAGRSPCSGEKYYQNSDEASDCKELEPGYMLVSKPAKFNNADITVNINQDGMPYQLVFEYPIPYGTERSDPIPCKFNEVCDGGTLSFPPGFEVKEFTLSPG